ncbi:glycoside hydrolase family 3 protein [Streptomyces aurantiacus]|uniref:beta-N-acetylhexosaminidase n=1 Tax=Streptomyces aurantiacus JA 4570 TaxID=1286094 RepID=S4ALS2_9ACTN|nr:glycoside hydrolase family 3 protein [Streptomyces aurantiacus]EPH42387.1 putative lipoprotein YbbD [Streptomyces aurantiacus JA 4570]
MPHDSHSTARDHADDTGPDDALLARMTLEEKVGQLFVLHVYGHHATAPDPADVELNERELGVRTAADAVAKYRPGGLIYFGWAHNTRDPRQLAALSDDVQRVALDQPPGIPLLLTIDQEHGVVARVGAPATLLPGAMALGAGGSADDVREAARIAGAELRALGVFQNYAPSADVNVNPANPVIGVRSFGAGPDAVSAFVTAQIEGYRDAGIAPAAKHFPGHGDTETDSHSALPYIHHTREQWEELDAPPFRAALAAGVDVVMTAHIVVPALDPALDPATLSHPIVTGILREQLGHEGVVVTDSLSMRGVRTKYGDDRVAVLAIKAGVDQLLNPPQPELAWNAVLQAVREGELTEARIDESVLRILRLKRKLGLFEQPYAAAPDDVDALVGSTDHLAAADRIAERTTTLLRNEGGLLPLSPAAHGRVLVLGADPVSPSGTTGPPTTVLAAALTELGFTATALSTGTEPSPEAVDKALAEAASGHDAVIVTTYDVTEGDPQHALVTALTAAPEGPPVITISVRTPHDVTRLPGVAAALAAYSWTDVELRAAARVIAGRARPVGRLPVPVPSPDDPAQVLYPIGYGLSYEPYAAAD